MIPEIDALYAIASEARAQDPEYALIVRFISAFAEERGVLIRSDAKYFIANNIVEMVSVPISLAAEDNIGGLRNLADFEVRFNELYANDLMLIINSAARVTESRGRTEISSTSALLAIAEVIDELRINQVKLWGRAAETPEE